MRSRVAKKSARLGAIVARGGAIVARGGAIVARGALACVLLAACGGDDDEGGDKPPPRQAAGGDAPAAAAGQGQGKAAKTALQVYPKVEDMVPENERTTIRHQFRDRDFMSDPTGSENRDPFRSYVVNQPGLIFETTSSSEQTDQCSKLQLVATKFSLRDLRLVGIVSKGTKRFALFQDIGDLGHIVGRGDCLGKEKARVKDIGAGFVTLETTPEQAPGQPPRQAEERSIPLYPEELPINDDNDTGGVNAPAPAPTPSMPPPSMPPPQGP